MVKKLCSCTKKPKYNCKINEFPWLDIQHKVCQPEHKSKWSDDRKSHQGTWTYLEHEYRPTKKLENIEQAKRKQEVLATLASIFDPLGMITPVTFKMKLFLQELWEKEEEWHERLSSEEITTWKGIMVDLNGISLIHLPRFVGNVSSQLLCFCDSSSKAYATVIYLCTIKTNKITVRFFLRQEMHWRRNLPYQG